MNNQNEKITDKYVYIDENSLFPNVCETIINIFNNDNSNKKKGVCGVGYNTNVKCSTDYIITHYDDNWKDIHTLLLSNLHEAITKYESQINNNNYSHFKDTYLKSTVFQLQHYKKNDGKFIYHNDSRFDFEKKEERTLVYMWYLNDVTIGGETDFIDFNIKPTTGKLVIFPSTWTYPHCANIPISGDKYIITGWIIKPVQNKPIISPAINNLITKNTNEKEKMEPSKINDTRFIQRYIHKDIFCNIICDWLIKEFNTVNNSHEIPPNIIDINKIPHINYFLLSNFHSILNKINTYYNNNNTSIVINYIHIVKYTVFDKVNDIVENDDSILQIRIALNDEHTHYDGGKLIFNNMVTKMEKGSMLVFLNNNEYTHYDILSGEQMVLIAGLTL